MWDLSAKTLCGLEREEVEKMPKPIMTVPPLLHEC